VPKLGTRIFSELHDPSPARNTENDCQSVRRSSRITVTKQQVIEFYHSKAIRTHLLSEQGTIPDL
jgi:hypothetical protein